MKTNILENTPTMTAVVQAGIGARKMQKIFDNIKKTATALYTKPFLVPLPMEINFEGASYPTFTHGRGLRQAHIIIGLKGGPEPLHFRGESQVLENIYDHIKEFSYSNELMKRFDVTRFSPVGTVGDTRVVSSYMSFIKEIFSVMYKNAYDKTLPLNINLSIRKNNDLSLENSNDLLLHDLLSESAFSAVSYFNEIYEKITDDELGCSVMISSHNFLHPINQLLSPAALALSFWQYNLLGLKKAGKDENLFAKSSLPRVTYIDITGFFSEINLEMVNALSENTQTILVYDSSTGGPSILKGGCYDPGQDTRSRDRNFTQISNDNALLIPLRSTNNYGEKVYSPNDMLGIFDELIVRSIEKFKPSLIVLNVSFIFDELNNLPFWLDEKTFGEILNTLNTLSDGRVVVYPFKLPDLRKNPSDRATFNKLKDLLGDKPKQIQRLENIFTKYGVSYNPSYLTNCLSSTLEALADMRNSNTWERSDIRKRYGTNPVKADTVHQICRFYKSHNYYNFLYSKATGALARLNKENVVKVKQGRSSKIPVFYNNKDGDTTMLKLSFQNGCRKIELDEHSQYFVDYNNPEEPHLYIFNAILSETDLGVAVPRSTSHIKVPLEIDDTTHPHVNITDITENDLRQFIVDKEKGVYTDVGICKSGDYIFQVYGTQCNQKGQKKDVTEIFCYDFENEKTFPIKLKGGSHNIMPRHSVTACAFEKDNMYHIYVFGGVAQPKTWYNGKEWGGLDIIDIVESYKTTGPITAESEWEYFCRPKGVMYKSSNACYIPYIQSYAYYSEDINKILILGGRMFRDSVQEWAFPIFEFDIAEQRFSSFQVVLNYTRNNFSRKEVKNHNSKKAAFPIAVANKNINFRMLIGDKKFKFIIPTEDPEYIYTYQFDWKNKECQYEQILHKEDKAEEKTPVLPSQTSVPGKNVPMTTRISEIMDYFSTNNKGFGKVVIKLIDWRSDIDVDVIKEEIFQEKLKEFKEQPNEDFTDQEEFKSIVDSLEKLVKLKDFKDIFLNRDNRLQLLKNYLSRKSPREDAVVETEFPTVDYSFKPSDLRTEYKSLPEEIKKSGRNMTKICISLIDWRLKHKQEKIPEQTLYEKMERIIKAVVKSKDSSKALEYIERLLKNEKLIKILISDTDQLRPLRKTLSGVEGQNFLFSDSTRDSSSSLEESVDSFYLSTRDTIFTKDDLQWSDLDPSQKNNVLEILNKSIQLFSTLSEDPKSFSVKAFTELDQGLQRVRKCLAKDSDSSWLMNSLEDTIKYMTKTYNSSTRNPILSISSDSNASRETAASLHVSEPSLTSDLSFSRSYDKNFMKVKEDFSNISVKQLLHTLSTGCQQVINVSHMYNAGVTPQIEYSRDLFERKFLEPLYLIKNNLEGEISHEQSIADSSQINSILKSTNQDDNQLDTKNVGQILQDIYQPPSDSTKPVQKQPIAVSPQEQSIAATPQKQPATVSSPKQAVVSPLKQIAPVLPPKEQTLKEPAVQPIVKHVETKKQEIQTESLSLPSVPVKVEDEKKIDDLDAFKNALSVQNNYHAFFNSSRSELTITANDKDGKPFTRRLRFKVFIKDASEQNYILEDISFENSPSSIWIHNDCVVCYIDQTIKIRYQDVYKVYKSWILYADLKTNPEHSGSWKEVEYLVFKKLFLITQDDQMINRCLVTDESNLFLLAGKSYRFRKNNAVTNNQVSLYNLKKFTQIGQTSSQFKDPDADNLESIKGESVSVSTPKYIFICPRKDPSKMEIYDKKGNVVEEVDLLGNFKNSFVSMTYVNFKGKDAILFTQHRTDKNREFKLYYIKEKSFEEEEVKLEPTEMVEEDKKFQLLYSGFEEPEVNTTTKPIADMIMFNIIREDITKCVPCKITIG